MTTAPANVTSPAAYSYTPTAAATDTKTSTNSSDPTVSQDRFLKLLVAQLNNQDPMNPMDNAQMTSQIAQINTVTGIQQLNATVSSLAGQFASMQAMQGNSLIGHEVLTEGSTLVRDAQTGKASGSFDLGGAATSVSVQVISPGGQLLDTVSLGVQEAGRHSFDWDASKYTGNGAPTFKVVAANGSQNVAATPLVRDTVVAVSTQNNALTLQLSSGASIAYSNVKAVM